MSELRLNKDYTTDLLLEKFNSRDSSAFSQVYLLYADELFFFANKLFRNTEISANDVLQDVFINLWQAKKQKFDGLSNIKAYLFISVRNNFKNYVKHQKHIDRHQYNTALEDDNFIAQIAETEVFSFINEAIDMLPEECGRVFKYYLEGLDIKEIATILEKSESTVYNQKNRSIQILKQKMKQDKLLILLFFIK